MAGTAGAPAGKLPRRGLDPFADRGFVTQSGGRDAITPAGVALLDAHRQSDGGYLFGTFRVGPVGMPVAGAK